MSKLRAAKLLQGLNGVVESQRALLGILKKARTYPGVKSTFYNIIGGQKLTGSGTKKILKEALKHRKAAALQVRALEKRQVMKVKWDGNFLHHLKRLTQGHKNFVSKMNPNDKAGIEYLTKDLQKYKEAGSVIVNRQINARAKGIRFVKINGRIVPIRPKK